MGTYTEVFALTCSPRETRRPTIRAAVANFGVRPPTPSNYDGEDPQQVLGRVLFGFAVDAGRSDPAPSDDLAPWVVFEPAEVVRMRHDLRRAIAKADASTNAYDEWFGSQLRSADSVFEHAERNRQWVVSVFEGDVRCFLQGGLVDRHPSDDIFAPHCKEPPLIPIPTARYIELGIVALLVPGLALAGWRLHRLRVQRTARAPRR